MKKKETHFNGYQRVEKIILKKQTPKKQKKKSLYEATALMIDDKVKVGPLNRGFWISCNCCFIFQAILYPFTQTVL